MTELEYYLDRIKSHQKFKREEMKFKSESRANSYKDALTVDILGALACILKTLVKHEDHEGI